MTQLWRVAAIVVGAEFAIAIALIVYAGCHDLRDVFVGAPAGLRIEVSGRCQAADTESPCHVIVTELSYGRYRLATDVAASSMTAAIAAPDSVGEARVVLVSAAQSAMVHLRPAERRLAVPTDHQLPADSIALTAAAPRAIIPVPAAGLESVSFSVAGAATAPFVVTEFGLFGNDRGLSSDVRPAFAAIPPDRYHATLVPRAIAQLALFTAIAAFFVPPSLLSKANPFLLAAVCFSLCLLDLAALFSPFMTGDLRAFYASGPLQQIAGSNLNGAIWEAARFLDGRGFTIADGLVSWAKMPGYGLFAVVAGVLFGHRTLLDLAIATVCLQVLFYSASVGFLAWAAVRLWSPPVVWTVGVLLAILPKQLGYTQVDSMIAPIAIAILGTLCLRIAACVDGRPVPLRVDAMVHGGFAIWFLMRPDVLPAWVVVSLVLHARTPRRMLMPAALAILIGIGWATYKMQYTGEFVPTTSTSGASLLCGLWEVPSRFPWVCSDDSYFAWVAAHTPFDPKSQAGSNVVVREVLRFWATFPGHFVLMVYDKLLRCLSGELWPGTATDLQQSIFQMVPRGSLALTLLATVSLAIATGYERARTLLLAWPLFLNAPLFWIMQSSNGRYYGGVGVALIVSAVPLLLDRRFYGALVARYSVAATVLVGVAVLATAARPLHDWLFSNDAFHYWSPFLDASSSSWGILK
jgi:hypothetical protein